MPRLENWSIVSTNISPYAAPELASPKLEGNIYDDEKGRFPDGSYVLTSRIVEFDSENMVAQTRNTKYILGEMSKEFQSYLDGSGHKLSDYDAELI